MAQRLIACIQNFSEARRSEIIDAIAEVIKATPKVLILDRHSDTDHNRSVITFVGPPEPVGDAAFSAIAKAAELIDLDKHKGQHPRIGATDVVPFVPFSGVKIKECVELSHRVGKRVGDELGIPVYLYEAAATRPERTNLEKIRKGEYEGLKKSIVEDQDRAPDYGPARLGKAGATVIGARKPLIAYNVYLTSEDINIAKHIARAVRHSSGGLRYVKALGMLVDGRAQVSMNLTDYTRTPIARVVEFIRREAFRYGVAIHHSELVGLIPQKALVDAAQWYLQLDQFEDHQILESRVYESLGAVHSEPSFLERLASSDPTPGGGSAAAYSAAMAAGLAAMVGRLTIGRKKYAAVEDQMKAIVEEADKLRQSLDKAVILDAQAFDAVMAALHLPKETEEQKSIRREAIERATIKAAEVPLEVAGQATRVLELAAEAAELGNCNAISDTGSSGAMARAALTAAGLNVQINAQSVSDQKSASGWLKELQELEARAAAAEKCLKQALKERGKLQI
jgi:glutamate formiminotransferase/formiminotetrahydrofolate cyclodeaminase